METQNEIEYSDINMDPQTLVFELGDIIQLQSPANDEYHDLIAYIEYIDDTQIHLITTDESKKMTLLLKEDGTFYEESIKAVYLLNRSSDKGYARQNNLTVNSWVNLRFGGEIPQLITGQITNLVEDMIEITTWPELNVFYIDFGFKGVPLHIPLQEIVLREVPMQLKLKKINLAQLRDESDISMEGEESKEEEQPSMEYTDEGEAIINIPENAIADETFKTRLEELYIDVDNITFGEKLEKVAQLVEVPEDEQRYSIVVQVNDMMDELLSTTPNYMRSKSVMNHIHMLISRFKELRGEFSLVDKNETITGYKKYGAKYKPLVEKIHRIDQNLKWIVPVVKQRNKLYPETDNDEETENSVDYTMESLGDVLETTKTKQNSYFDKNKNNFDYGVYENEMNEILKPFDEPLNGDDVLHTGRVLGNIDTIVENLEDFQSSVFKQSDMKNVYTVSREKFLIQRYNLGLERLGETIMKNGKSVFKKESLTHNDTISISSILMLPAPVIEYSKMYLPATNLLKKANYHFHLFSLTTLLKNNKDIIPHVIDDLSEEFDYYEKESDYYEKESDDNYNDGDTDAETDIDEQNGGKGGKGNNIYKVKERFFKQFNQFILDENAPALSNDKYKDFLEAILPKTKVLVEIVRKYIKDKISFYSVIRELEPFMIYSDNISYKQFLSIRRMVIEKMKELKIVNETKNNDLLFIKNSNYNTGEIRNTIKLLLAEKNDVVENIMELYKFQNNVSTPEAIKKMYELDSGNLYYEMIQSIMYTLLSPDNLISSFSKIEDVTDVDKIRNEDCGTKYLAKKYTKVEDLQEDSETEIFFDFPYDDTPYNILEKYQDEQKRMDDNLFFNFLVENLIEKHSCLKEKAAELAKTLLSGKKIVENGHYAILELKPKLRSNIDDSKLSEKEKMEIEIESEIKKRTSYYKRVNSIWILDDSITDNSFMDNNELFCNMSEFCFKNKRTKHCEDMSVVQSRYRDYTKKTLVNEFEDRFALTSEELEEKIEKYVALYSSNIKKIYRNKILQEYAYNNIAYTLSNYANEEPVLISPYLNIRDTILSLTDYPKKQNYITKFVDNFCREPLIESLKEHPHWFYCKKTNTKLFPHSLYNIAKSFINNGNVGVEMDIIIKKYGTDSDDGDAIVDKYSGYILQKRDLVFEDNFNDQGQKISSHDIMQEELGVITEKQMKTNIRVFENELNEMNFNILKSLCNNTGININNVEEFVRSLAVSFCDNPKYLLTEDKYNKKAEKVKKQDKKPLGSYIDYRNERRILIVSSLLFVAVQISVPSIQIKKTFPGCVKSFDGFPQTGIENIDGIKYLSCILFSMKSKFEPWNVFGKLNQDKIKNRLVDVMENFIVTYNEISEKYNKKREYLELYPETFIPDEHAIEKWKQFNPPLITTGLVDTVSNVSSDFEKELTHQLKKNSPKQNIMINVINNKNRSFTYVLIDSINAIISNKTMMLKTKSEVPFLENACCNENLADIMPLVYFTNEDPTLLQYLKYMHSNQKLIDYVSDISKPSILYHNYPTRVNYPSLPSGILEKDVYEVIIHYCNLDREEPIPEELKEFMDEKPTYYNKDQSIDEKIVLMKKNGKRYTMTDLQNVLNIVNRRNMIYIEGFKNYDKMSAFKDVIESLLNKESNILQTPCLEHLLHIIEKYQENKNKMFLEYTELGEVLQEYLLTSNKNMRGNIEEFLRVNGNLKPTDFTKLIRFINTIHMWEMDNAESTPSENYFYELFHNICNIYPTILLKDAMLSYSISSSKQKKFADKHIIHIENYLKKHFSGLEQFKNDTIILKLLELVQPELRDVMMFIRHLPIYSEIVKKEGSYYSFLHKDTYKQLYLYTFYSVLEFLILSIDHDDLIIRQTNIQRNQAKEVIEENRDPSTYIEAANTMINEENEGAMANLDEVLIYTGQKEELRKKISNYIVATLNIDKNTKETVNMSYESIMKKVNRAREREKQNKITKLGELSIEERKVENKFKKYRLEKWNIGQQKALVDYNKNMYDREVNELLEQVTNEIGGNLLNVNQYDGYENMEVFIEDLDNQEQHNNDADADAEYNNIQDLGEHFMDGQYYEEDIENDFE
uniref:Uncharacterized protein n=1 Tax=viral metagenome TaxID=1070528 RepID=A0A6C0ISH3_9ZZZZ